jgi:hypothetical protein
MRPLPRNTKNALGGDTGTVSSASIGAQSSLLSPPPSPSPSASASMSRAVCRVLRCTDWSIANRISGVYESASKRSCMLSRTSSTSSPLHLLWAVDRDGASAGGFASLELAAMSEIPVAMLGRFPMDVEAPRRLDQTRSTHHKGDNYLLVLRKLFETRFRWSCPRGFRGI